ncbi:MAG TPA: AAA family ATPase [Candidatus Polarisedimenticolia bacterium]|nr:AAA family ATPase [Candidatus Polarisedimenticolia bacterium]
MTTAQSSAIEVIVLSARKAFQEDVGRMLSGDPAVTVAALRVSPGGMGARECVQALDRQPGAVLVIDAVPDSEAALTLVGELFGQRPEQRIFISGPATEAELILKAQRAGAAEYLPQPLDRSGLMEAMQRHRMRQSSSMTERRKGRIISFVGAKGGCGTTTVAANLAVTLASRGTETVLIDLHPAAGEVALLVNEKPRFALSDVVHNLHRLDRALLEGMVLRHSSGLKILTANEAPGGRSTVAASNIGQILRFLRDHFECVVVDAGDVCSPLAEIAVGRADVVHVVTRLDLLSLHRAQWAFQRLTHWGVGSDQVRLVINRCGRNPYVSIGDAEKVLGVKSAWSIPEDQRIAMEALNEGTPFVVKDRNGLRTSYARYAEILQPADDGAAVQRKKFLGLLSLPGQKIRKESGATA